jgi:hypothetical protein
LSKLPFIIIETAKTAEAAGERPAERPKRATAAADGKPKAAKAKGQSGGGPSIFRGIFIEVGNAFTLIDAANEFKKEFAKGAGRIFCSLKSAHLHQTNARNVTLIMAFPSFLQATDAGGKSSRSC